MGLSLYQDFLRPLLFRMDAESAHERVVRWLELASELPGFQALIEGIYGYEHESLEIEVAGLKFPNPVGLAAGFDKDCRLTEILPAFGFGFIEVGTVTPRPQPGNPRPRIFRIPEAQAVINRLGFNNAGADAAVRRLSGSDKPPVPLGINLGINADTPQSRAVQDYVDGYSALAPYGDYFVINVSSPNTKGLQELQDRLHVERILTALRAVKGSRKRLFVKVSADIESSQLMGLVPLLVQEADGVIVCNTTRRRDGIPDSRGEIQGGLSGAPLRSHSTNMIAEVYRMSKGRLPIIGVGGIFSAQDAYQKLRAGASLVQIYTGMIYKGPGLVSEINRGIVKMLQGHKLERVEQTIGLSSETPEPARP